MKTAKGMVILVVVYTIATLGLTNCSNEQLIDDSWTPKILSDETLYLPDWSTAGYAWGERDIPVLEPTLYAKDFGVVADDGEDDSDALQAAFKAVHEAEGTVVLRLPAGKIILSEILYIERSNFVLQGAGDVEGGTVIYMSKALSEIPDPDELTELREYLIANNKRQREKDRGIDEPFSQYAWSGGFIWVQNPSIQSKIYLKKYYREPEVLADITNGKRGSRSFLVKDASLLKAGEAVRINWFNKDGEESSLIDHLYDEKDVVVGLRHWENPDVPIIKQEVTIMSVEGNTVTLKEQLLHDLRQEWYPTITRWDALSQIGIEDIKFEFPDPDDTYIAHHLEKGYNAIYLTNVTQSWCKNVSVHNGDSGILIEVSSNISIEGGTYTGKLSHYTIMFGDVSSLFGRNVTVNGPCRHSLSFNTGAKGCVYTDCSVNVKPSLDQHGGANHQNLFDNINILETTAGRTFFYKGGDGYWSPTHGAFSTFWNIAVDFAYENAGNKTIELEGVPNGPSARLIGLHANYPMEITYGPAAYMEGINKAGIAVPSLYEYQLNKRLNGQ